MGDADCGSIPSSLMSSTTFDRNIPAEEREKLENLPLVFVTRRRLTVQAGALMGTSWKLSRLKSNNDVEYLELSVNIGVSEI